MMRKAHVANTDITSLAFSKDNFTLLSRAADDTLKVLAEDLDSSANPACNFQQEKPIFIYLGLAASEPLLLVFLRAAHQSNTDFCVLLGLRIIHQQEALLADSRASAIRFPSVYFKV